MEEPSPLHLILKLIQVHEELIRCSLGESSLDHCCRSVIRAIEGGRDC
jgi:hypothetical protein